MPYHCLAPLFPALTLFHPAEHCPRRTSASSVALFALAVLASYFCITLALPSLFPRSYALSTGGALPSPHFCLVGSSFRSCRACIILLHYSRSSFALPPRSPRSSLFVALAYVSMVFKKQFPLLWISRRPYIDVHIAMLSNITKCPFVHRRETMSSIPRLGNASSPRLLI